jgi:integrase
MAKWHATKFKGIRYRKHESRKHGVTFDKYFTIRFQARGKRVEEGLGWASEGWGEKKAALELEKLKENYKKGEGPIRLKKKRDIARKKEEAEILQRITFDDAYKEYILWSRANKKSWEIEEYNYGHYLKDYLGKKLLADITPYYLEQIKMKLFYKGYAPGTVKQLLALVRGVFSKAIRWDKWDGENPFKKVKMPKINNKKERVLQPDEEKDLMSRLRIKTPRTWAMAMISLYSGLRFAEVANLRWQHLNFKQKKIAVIDGKGNKSRTVPMNNTVSNILSDFKPSSAAPHAYIFPSKKKGPKGEEFATPKLSGCYYRTIQEIGLNDGINDRRYKISFHTLRHTYVTRLASAGTPLHVLRDLLGHSDLTMVSRYAHLIPGQADIMVAGLDKYQK